MANFNFNRGDLDFIFKQVANYGSFKEYPNVQ